MKRCKSQPVTCLIALYAILGGLAFLLIQTSQLLNPDLTNTRMASLPLGYFNWGYVWSDTLVAGPALLIGGILLLTRSRIKRRLGQLFAFTGFAVNLYAMIGLWIGFGAIDQPMHGFELWMNIILTFLGLLCMIQLGIQTARDERNDKPENGI